MTDNEEQDANQTTAKQLLSFLWSSPSPFHCIAEAMRRLDEAGFQRIDERAEPPDRIEPGHRGYTVRGGSLVAWRAGTASPAEAGFRLLGAHTDSPNFRVKPRPDVRKEGFRQVGIEPYGGVIFHTWTDRDLGLSGKVVVQGSAGPEIRLFRTDKPVARIANLAIHLDREVNEKGPVLNAQTHLQPIVGIGDGPELSAWLAEQMGVDTIHSWELGLHDVQPPVLGGMDDDFVFSARLDNQVGCFVTLQALIECETGLPTQVVALMDHEEIGSASYRGAAGPFIRSVFTRLERSHAEQSPGGMERAVPNSVMVSFDMAHGVHPNFADKHEPAHKPLVNGGPIIKQHAMQRYATEAETVAMVRLVCAELGVPCQDFITRSDLGCGTTIGPIVATKLGIRSIDMGSAMLAMHSARETCGAKDLGQMIEVMKRVLVRN